MGKHPGGRPKKPASERATAVVHVRVTAARKAAYDAAAKARGISLARWVTERLDMELAHVPECRDSH